MSMQVIHTFLVEVSLQSSITGHNREIQYAANMLGILSGILSGLGVHDTKYFGYTILAVKPSPSPLKRRIIMQQTCKFMLCLT